MGGSFHNFMKQMRIMDKDAYWLDTRMTGNCAATDAFGKPVNPCHLHDDREVAAIQQPVGGAPRAASSHRSVGQITGKGRMTSGSSPASTLARSIVRPQ